MKSIKFFTKPNNFRFSISFVENTMPSLGFWDISNDIISKAKIPGSYYVNNQSYKDYRRDYNKGGDFLIISNYEEIDDNYKFIIEESLIKG